MDTLLLVGRASDHNEGVERVGTSALAIEKVVEDTNVRSFVSIGITTKR